MQGKAGSETVFGEPLDAALAWQTAGAEWIHLVDLDAAFGRGSNDALIAEVVGRLDVAVEVSGGITLDTVRAYADAGADLISTSVITQSAPALDLAFDLRPDSTPKEC